ncbi:hypothetical protein FB45DRAFT_1061310 [Roridomyces roridus]|uniref:Uncharacterized protein n=1 Tax=Roridomyces roridus TaxID=1738132 RepID=A0AAD7BK63_9AGAR|nr:hypothetical protein FB45DRAFT_1061310 [Roridomyces roridus]
MNHLSFSISQTSSFYCKIPKKLLDVLDLPARVIWVKMTASKTNLNHLACRNLPATCLTINDASGELDEDLSGGFESLSLATQDSAVEIEPGELPPPLLQDPTIQTPTKCPAHFVFDLPCINLTPSKHQEVDFGSMTAKKRSKFPLLCLPDKQSNWHPIPTHVRMDVWEDLETINMDAIIWGKERIELSHTGGELQAKLEWQLEEEFEVKKRKYPEFQTQHECQVPPGKNGYLRRSTRKKDQSAQEEKSTPKQKRKKRPGKDGPAKKKVKVDQDDPEEQRKKMLTQKACELSDLSEEIKGIHSPPNLSALDFEDIKSKDIYIAGMRIGPTLNSLNAL